MTSNIKVSIIIPVYNAEKYLKKCLDSIERQTMKEYEIVFVNDGSTDNTKQIIEEFKNKKICQVRCKDKKNAGQAAARNEGLAMAEGEYVAFMDSDDYIKPDYLEKLYQAAVEYNSQAVTCGYYMVDEQGKLIRKIRMSENGVERYGRAGMYVVWCRLYKRDFLQEHQFRFQEGGKIYEDAPYSICTKFQSQNPIAIDYEGYYYVQRPGSTMSSGAVKSSRFPFEKMTEAIESSLAVVDAQGRERLEFEVLHFYAGFFFRYCRKAKKEDLDVLVKYARKILSTICKKSVCWSFL